jgi:hypothetical protein
MNAKLLLLAGALCLLAAGSAVADPITINLNCSAAVEADAFAVLQAATGSNPVAAAGATVDAVNGLVSDAGNCVSLG